jgi:glyoxylase-like metal-dependent hydrolase (beta-lactamase superfamily II)
MVTKEMIMSKTSFRFQVGKLECFTILDGTFTYTHPAQLFFANAPQDRLVQVLQEHNITIETWDGYVSPYPSLVIDTGKHRLLVDTGAGDLAPTTGHLVPNLQKEGIKSSDIDIVVLTHGHPDHIGGIVDGEGKLTFPNARYIMCKDEWEFWASEPELTEWPMTKQIKQLIRACARSNLPPIQNQLDVIGNEEEILPGIRVISSPGHTPGHISLSISSEDERLFCTSDTLIHPIHIEQIDWFTAFDLAPEQALASRRRLLEKAATEKALIFSFHFPLPGLGHIIQKGDKFQWQDIKMEAMARLE